MNEKSFHQIPQPQSDWEKARNRERKWLRGNSRSATTTLTSSLTTTPTTASRFSISHSLSLSLKTLSVSLSKIVNCCCFLQTLKSQLFSLTSVAPDDQKVLSLSLSLYVFVCVCVCVYIYIFKNLWEIVFLQIIAVDENRVLSDDSDLISVSERLRLVSVNVEVNEQPQPQLSSHIAGNDAASVIKKSWSKFHSFFGFGSGFSWKWFWFWWFIGEEGSAYVEANKALYW